MLALEDGIKFRNQRLLVLGKICCLGEVVF